MKILVADPLSEKGMTLLKNESDIQADSKTGLKPEELIKIIGDYDGMIVRSETQVTEDIINAGKKLKVIGRAGVGLDNIDVPAATRRGIIVMNVPGGNTISTAEHTCSLLLSMSRNIPQAFISLKSGKWDRKKFTGVELFGKTLGVVGLGRIGMEVTKRMQAFGMHVLAYDPYVTKERGDQLGVKIVELKEIFTQADYITVHVPLTKETKALIGEEEMKIMKKNVRLINCARGGIIEEKALYENLKSGKVAAAAVDVFEKEPPPADHPLLTLENFIATPHLGAATTEAQVQVAVDIAQQLIDTLKGRMVRNACNIPSVEPEVLALVGPYLTLAEKLGRLQSQLIEGRVEEIHIRYSGDVSGVNVAPITIAAVKGFLEPILKENINYVNAPFIAKERGIRVVESKSTEVEDYATLITISAKIDGQERVVAGTLFGKRDLRLVRIDDYRIECDPSGYLLIISNEDVPGIVGSVGTLLGKHKVNIANMALGRNTKGGKAVTGLNVDEEVSEKVLSELRKLPHVLEARLVKL